MVQDNPLKRRGSETRRRGGGEDVSRVSNEVVQLRRLVGDVQIQLGRQHRDARGWLGKRDQRFLYGIEADDGVMGRLDFVVAMLMAVRGEGFDTPRQACVLPPWKFAEAHGLSEEEQSPEVWVKRLQEWLGDDCKEGKGSFKKKKRFFVVCAHIRRLVPCGPNGQGHNTQQPRTWFRMSVSVATFALQVVCSTLTAMAAVPVAGVLPLRPPSRQQWAIWSLSWRPNWKGCLSRTTTVQMWTRGHR